MAALKTDRFKNHCHLRGKERGTCMTQNRTLEVTKARKLNIAKLQKKTRRKFLTSRRGCGSRLWRERNFDELAGR